MKPTSKRKSWLETSFGVGEENYGFKQFENFASTHWIF